MQGQLLKSKDNGRGVASVTVICASAVPLIWLHPRR